jgi:phosphoglycerate dehydrogenase-like enzyme
MDVLVTLPVGLREELFDDSVRERLEGVGGVTYNPADEQFSPAELRERLDGVEVCVTGWGTPTLDETVLAGADALELLAHVGGSVAPVASPAIYDRGVVVTSANRTMARYVAEGVLGMALAGLRDLPAVDRSTRRGEWNGGRSRAHFGSLFDTQVGFVGLGTVGRNLLDLLAPFEGPVRVYDPYADDDPAFDRPGVERTDLETALSSDVVSVHASLTEETLGLLDADRLAEIPDGGLLVNCARGPIVDEDALADELADGRIRAALDVYTEEPLPAESPLTGATVLTPHIAGAPSGPKLAPAVLDEVERYAAGEPVESAIGRERYELMTRDWLREQA